MRNFIGHVNESGTKMWACECRQCRKGKIAAASRGSVINNRTAGI